MSRSTVGLSPNVEQYLSDQWEEHPVLKELRHVTAEMPMAMMQIGPSQGAFMAWLLRLIGARRTIEVGVFTGYSSLVTALNLPEEGRVLACDVSEEWTAVAREHFRKAGVEHKIDLVLQPATTTLEQRLLAGESNHYDFAFIDADKENQADYFDLCVRLVRPGGLVLVDNALWSGSVADKTDQRQSTQAIRELNRRVRGDSRVHSCLAPIGDGLLLCTKL